MSLTSYTFLGLVTTLGRPLSSFFCPCLLGTVPSRSVVHLQGVSRGSPGSRAASWSKANRPAVVARCGAAQQAEGKGQGSSAVLGQVEDEAYGQWVWSVVDMAGQGLQSWKGSAGPLVEGRPWASPWRSAGATSMCPRTSIRPESHRTHTLPPAQRCPWRGAGGLENVLLHSHGSRLPTHRAWGTIRLHRPGLSEGEPCDTQEKLHFVFPAESHCESQTTSRHGGLWPRRKRPQQGKGQGSGAVNSRPDRHWAGKACRSPGRPGSQAPSSLVPVGGVSLPSLSGSSLSTLRSMAPGDSRKQQCPWLPTTK